MEGNGGEQFGDRDDSDFGCELATAAQDGWQDYDERRGGRPEDAMEIDAVDSPARRGGRPHDNELDGE
eukprot:14330-Pyramimonas_sp.AAC.1